MHEVSRPTPVRGARTTKSHASKPASETTRSRSPGDVLCAVGSHDLEKEIAEIARLSLDDLRIRWRNLKGRLAPAYLSRALLVRILAYRVQVQTFGDLDRNTARALVRWETVGRKEPRAQTSPNGTDESIDVSSAPDRRASEPLILKPGTLLTREWQGRMETVMVVPTASGGTARFMRAFRPSRSRSQAQSGTVIGSSAFGRRIDLSARSKKRTKRQFRLKDTAKSGRTCRVCFASGSRGLQATCRAWTA